MKLTKAQSGLEFDCQDTLEIMDLYVVFPDELTASERNDAAEHMLACKSCRDKYLQMKLTDTALRVNRNWLKEQGAFGESDPDTSQVEISEKEISRLRFENMMDRALNRRKRRERRVRIAKIKRIAKPISAIAACLIIALGIWGIIVNNSVSKTSTRQPIAANPTKNPVKIELLTNSGNEIIQAGQPILAAARLKTLRVNGNRKMVLNIGTKLSIEPYDLGCVVKLDRGEIYAEVEHDGKPFIVEAIHGRAVITGTTFNIKADDNQMQLIVTEGTVKFEGDNGFVDVTADHKSTLALNAKPTIPQLCDADKLTAWATGLEELLPYAAKEPEIDLGFIFDSRQTDPDQIDYDTWVEQKQIWFNRQFPHIFKFKEALSREGIEVDYPELLVKSGDLWRFGFPGQTQTQLIPTIYESMIKLATVYNKDEKWLSDNLRYSRANLISQNESTSLKALEGWAKTLDKSLNSSSEINAELLINSLHASIYLAETRTLTWLAVDKNLIALTKIEKQRAANLLEQQIKAADNCTVKFKQMITESYSSNACDVEKQRKERQTVIENIETINEIEKMHNYLGKGHEQ